LAAISTLRRPTLALLPQLRARQHKLEADDRASDRSTRRAIARHPFADCDDAAVAARWAACRGLIVILLLAHDRFSQLRVVSRFYS
jgi:hypothetical protein